MKINFSNIDVKERPTIILRNLDNTPVGVLGHAFNIQLDASYNETSEIRLNYPAFVDGERTPHYDSLTGMKILDLQSYGQFLLQNPKTKDSGAKAIKSCVGYSLEFEFTSKILYLDAGTYNFWNPLSPGGTILSEIMSYMPSWSIGEVDIELVGKYRTFDSISENAYNFIKNSVQDTYNCVFEFDTYQRKVYVKSANSFVITEPIFLSKYNLIKDIEVDELTDELFTVFDVNGAEGVDIRNVNPTGDNKIRNLDHFMNLSNFSQVYIDKWSDWKQTYENYRLPYYNLTIEQSIQTSRFLTEQARFRDLQGELQNLENLKSVYIQNIAENNAVPEMQDKLHDINIKIREKNAEIEDQESLVKSVENEIIELNLQLININTATSLKSFFSEDEMLVLDRYFKEGSINESSFVVSVSDSYSASDVSGVDENITFSISNSDITNIANEHNKDILTLIGGNLSYSSNDNVITAEVVRSSVERKQNADFVLTAYLGKGAIGSYEFASGTFSIVGTCSPFVLSGGTSLSFNISTARFYFTRNTTEYEKRAVSWDLLEFGQKELEKKSHPLYAFKVDCANFLALSEFDEFKKHLTLGNKTYLELKDGFVLEPIVIKVSIDFENLSNFSFEFSDKFSTNDIAFKIKDILSSSISMGKTVDSSKHMYNSFVDSGAYTNVKKFIESAFDVAKNKILSSGGQAPSMDDSGFWLRKWNADRTGYEPEQIGMINQNIVFTTDGWETVNLAIGTFEHPIYGRISGTIGDYIVGTVLAGNNLNIECTKKDGFGNSVFRVDGDGVSLHNASINIYRDANNQITLNPYSGFAIGTYPLYSGDEYTINMDNAKFYVDLDGNVHVKGTLEADGDSIFRGIVRAREFQDLSGKTMLTSDYKFNSQYLDLGNIKLDGDTGNISMTGSINMNGNITLGGSINLSSGSITWGNNGPVKYQFSVNGTSSWHDTMTASDMYRRDSLDGGVTWGTAYQFRGRDGSNGSDGSDANVPGYIKQTYIDSTTIRSPTIETNLLMITTPQSWSGEGGLILRGYYGSNPFNMLKISYLESDAAFINFSSPAGAYASWGFSNTSFYGNVHFTGNVTGLPSVVAVFG